MHIRMYTCEFSIWTSKLVKGESHLRQLTLWLVASSMKRKSFLVTTNKLQIWSVWIVLVCICLECNLLEIKLPTYLPCYSKERLGFSVKVAIKIKKKNSTQHSQSILRVVLSLTQGGVTQRCSIFINSNYEVLVECVVGACPVHQGPLLHSFDSGDFILIYVWVL